MNLIKVRRGTKMSLFRQKSKETRSIEEILTPKNEAEGLENDENEDFVEKKDVESETPKVTAISPLECFGLKEEKTEKWLYKCVKIWYYFMSFVWFLFGAVTFAPVIFIGNKLNVVVDDKKKSILFAIILDIFLISLLVLFFSTRKT